MLKITILNDEELQGVVNVFISSLLPHKKYNPEYFSRNLNAIFSYIHLEEFEMEYYLLIKGLYNLNKIKVSFPDYSPRLTNTNLESLLSVSINDAVVQPEVRIKDWLDAEGLNSNLNIQAVREEACQKLVQRVLDLYETCFALEEKSNSVIDYELELRAAFMAHVSMQSINAQAAIYKHELRLGRRIYKGCSDWLEFNTMINSEIKNRINMAEDNNRVTLDSMANSNNLLMSLKSLFIPIANYGIPEIDNYTPILRHRLVVIVGKENIGKTKFAIDKAVNVLLAAKKVAFMCGESALSKVYADIIINYTYKKFGLILRPEHIGSPEDCPEDVRKIIGLVTDELISKKLLTLCEAFNYETLYDEMLSLYEEVGFDVLVIDHSCALLGVTGDGSLKAKVDKLSSDTRLFRKKYPVCVMVTSHPSTVAKESDTRGRITTDSPTKGSQNLSTDADDVFYLRDDETLQKQGLIKLENTKRRDAARLTDYVILRKRFDACAFIYDENSQAMDKTVTFEKEEALRALEGDYDNTEYTLS